MTLTIRNDDPVAIALIAAIRSGDLDALAELLGANPGLAAARLRDRCGSRTPLHVVTDWPGYFPNGPEVARALLAAGADPNAAGEGGQFAETPLHWAASSDDADVAEVLIDGGADIEAPGGSIAGTPLSNAVGYGCWHVARLLLARGARVEWLWQAAALGVLARVEELCADGPGAGEINDAFWQACHGGQRRVAEYLLGRGADINAHPDYADQTPLEIAQAPGTREENLIGWLREQGAKGPA